MVDFYNELERTMLIERLCGVLLYCFIVVLYYFSLKQATDPISVKRKLKRLTVILCVMAFFYIPAESADLYRWRETALFWKNTNIADFFKNVFPQTSAPVGYFIIYICQRTGINGLLPAFCALVFFSNSFHILASSAARFDFPNKITAVVFLFFMSAGMFLEVISGVRCFVAFSIVSRCFYDEMAESKSLLKSVPLYVIACLIHIATIPLVGIRMACLLFESKRNVAVKLFGIMIGLALVGAGMYFGADYVEAAIDRSIDYFGNESYVYFWEYLIGIFGEITIICVLIVYRKKYRRLNWQADNIYKALVLLTLVEIVFVGSYNIFHRFLVPIYFLMIPILGITLKGDGNCLSAQNNRLMIAVQIISVLILMLACTRGNLCGYKFFSL